MLTKEERKIYNYVKKNWVGKQVVLSGGGGLMNEINLVTLKDIRVAVNPPFDGMKYCFQAVVMDKRGFGKEEFKPYLVSWDIGIPDEYLKGLPNGHYYIPFVSPDPKEAEKQLRKWRQEQLREIKKREKRLLKLKDKNS